MTGNLPSKYFEEGFSSGRKYIVDIKLLRDEVDVDSREFAEVAQFEVQAYNADKLILKKIAYFVGMSSAKSLTFHTDVEHPHRSWSYEKKLLGRPVPGFSPGDLVRIAVEVIPKKTSNA